MNLTCEASSKAKVTSLKSSHSFASPIYFSHCTGTATKFGDSSKSGDKIEPRNSCDFDKFGDYENPGDTGDYYYIDGSGNSEESGDF